MSAWRDYLKLIVGEPERTSTVFDRAADAIMDGHKKPRLATVRNAPSREEFDAWRDHPVTLFVFAAMRAVAEEQEQSWHDQSWNGGNCDPIELNGLRARADTYTSMEEGGYESFCEWAGVEPEPLPETKEWGSL